MTALQLRKLARIYRTGLLDDTVPFWTRHAPDHEHGGFFSVLGADGTVLDTDKSVWHQGRFSWLLAELYNNVEQRPEWLELALSGGSFLQQHCVDPADGRMWFQVTADGRPLRKRRYAYSEAFACIAYGELAQATGDDAYRQLALDTFQRFAEHEAAYQDPQPKFTQIRPSRNIGHPMILIGVAQQLRDSIELPHANQWIDGAIDGIRRFHLCAEYQCVLETVGADGQFLDHLDGRNLNPGHAIEAAWFILREAAYRKDAAQRESLVQLGTQMLDWMWQWGWDEQYGGIWYFRDAKHGTSQEYWHDMKFWWPHNEALIATLLAHQLTGEPRYAQWHQQVHDWSYQHFPDAEHGEWFGYLRRDGSVSQTAKGTMWKGCFHLPRAQLLCWQMAEDMLR